MRRTLSTIAFDADDTLWHNERFFKDAQAEFASLLRDVAPAEAVHDTLLETERRNVRLYGFGVKGFTLSMMETALALGGAAAAGAVSGRILAIGREMLAHPVELLPGAEAALDALGESFDLMVITKGDLFDQERKLDHSGLIDRFSHVEIVSDKSARTYRRIFDRHGQGARRAAMVGNSLKSDVVPAIEAGAIGVFVPHPLTWALEHAEPPSGHPRFHQIETLAQLPQLVAGISAGISGSIG